VAIGTYALLLSWNEYLYAFLLLSGGKVGHRAGVTLGKIPGRGMRRPGIILIGGGNHLRHSALAYLLRFFRRKMTGGGSDHGRGVIKGLFFERGRQRRRGERNQDEARFHGGGHWSAAVVCPRVAAGTGPDAAGARKGGKGELTVWWTRVSTKAEKRLP